jgi:hypothetical protein
MRYLYLILLVGALVFGSRFIREFSSAIAQQRQSQAAATARLPSEQSPSAGDSSSQSSESDGSADVQSVGSQAIVSAETEARIAELMHERQTAQNTDTTTDEPATETNSAETGSNAQKPDRASPPPIRHQAPLHSDMVTPGNFEYVGAFRPPYVEGAASSFSYGGWGVAWRADGDPQGEDDGYPGSLFLTGHQGHQLVAEISIPRPYLSIRKDINELPAARLLQPFGDISGGLQAALTEDPSQPFQIGGMQVVGNSLHWTIYRYYNVEGYDFLSHGLSSLNTQYPVVAGPWHLGPFESGAPQWHAYKHAGYICEIPQDIADQWFGGRNLMSGLQISTGLQTSSQGPALFAYRLPTGQQPQDAELDAVPLLWYPMQQPVDQHHPADRWAGAAWLTLADKQAVIVVGHKALGPVYYGDPRPGDCYPDKGYHGSSYEAQVMFYTPAELIASANERLQAWDIKPWYRWNSESPGGGLTQYLLPTCGNDIGGLAMDRSNNLLYLVQVDAGATTDNEWEVIPVIHVFHIVD